MTERDDKHNERLAYHEAGHALFAHYLGWSIQTVTIIRNEKTGVEGEVSATHPKAEIIDEDQIAQLMAGKEAVKVAGCEKIYSNEGTELSDDIVEARSDIFAARAIADRRYPGAELLRDILLEAGRSKAEVIFEAYVDALHAIARALIEKKTITGTEIAEIVKAHPPMKYD